MRSLAPILVGTTAPLKNLKLQHWRGPQAKNVPNAAPVLEFCFYISVSLLLVHNAKHVLASGFKQQKNTTTVLQHQGVFDVQPHVSYRAQLVQVRVMSSLLSARPTPSRLDDDAWDDLLNFIEEKRVVPIVGPELLKVETESGPRLLYDWIAEKLAAKLNVDTSKLPAPYTLNDVVCWHLSSHGRREDTYSRMRSLLREATFTPPLALRQLAQITDFDLFVTTTFDGFLEKAINEERFGGAQSTEVIGYTPTRVADLPVARENLQRPVVYHLLGRVSASPTYVISDEDTLEFVCALQSEHLTPEKLFHELEYNHLLLIGSNFPTGWYACSCAWPSGGACPIRAMWGKCWPTITPTPTNA